MCATCGCGDDGGVRVSTPTGEHDADQQVHPHEHPRGHPHEPASGTVEIETALLARNDHLAQHTREWLVEHGLLALNLMSSPGSGKTSLLVRTITELAGTQPVCVVEGDQETLLDATRIRDTGAPVVQINTGAGCHLDADMLARGLRQLAPPDGALVFVENVGNLVCPALFDLGEAARVVIVSVTEGDDKPLKYPHMFAAADLVVVNKTDLLPYVDVELDRLAAHCRSVNPGVDILPLSVKSGEGMDAWYSWLRAQGLGLRRALLDTS